MKDVNKDIFATQNVNLIDFGLATPYLKDDGKTHVKKTLVNNFQGNIVFSSINQLKFYRTSRRDDIISIFYILVYLLKRGNMPGVKLEADYDPIKVFDLVKEAR